MKKRYIYPLIDEWMKVMNCRPVRMILWTSLALILLFALFLILITMKDYHPPDRTDLQLSDQGIETLPADTQFLAVTWNLGYFGLGNGMDFFYDGGEKVRPGRKEYENYFSKGLSSMEMMTNADFILFQEVDRNSRRSYRQDQFRELAWKLDAHSASFAVNYDVLFVPVPLGNPMGRVLSGLVGLGRYKPVECYRGSLPGQYPWPTRLFMLDRCYTLSRFRVETGNELVVIHTHNEAYDSGESRNRQMEHLRAIMLEEYNKGNYVLAGGDWNMNPVGYREGTFLNGDISKTVEPPLAPDFLPAGWQWAFDPSVPSNRSLDQAYRRGITTTTIIDFFVLSPNVILEEINTFDMEFQWSDHQPVMMKFSLGRI